MYKDGTSEIERIQLKSGEKMKTITKSFIKDKEVASIKLDPMKDCRHR
nr:hypothetical protein [Candidatus Brachybacter algidus]